MDKEYVLCRVLPEKRQKFLQYFYLSYSTINIYEKMKQKPGNEQNGHFAVRQAARSLWTLLREGKFPIWHQSLCPLTLIASTGYLGKVECLEFYFGVSVLITHFPCNSTWPFQ